MQTHYPPSQFVVPSPANPGLQLHLKDPSSFWHFAFVWQLWRPSTHSSISIIQWSTESVWDSAQLTTYPSPNSIFCPKWEMELNTIHLFRNEMRTGPKMCPAIVSGIVTGDTRDSYRLFFISKIQLEVYYQCCVLIGWVTTRLYVIAH